MIYGGAGDDFLDGNQGNDVLHGDAGDDEIHDTNGTDKLYGGAGDDWMMAIDMGKAGDDVLDGGSVLPEFRVPVRRLFPK